MHFRTQNVIFQRHVNPFRPFKVKSSLRNGVAKLLFMTGITAPARRGRGHLSIATFHRVLPEEERRAYPYPGLVVTPEELDALLLYFTQHFDCGALATQHRRHLGGAEPSRPLLALTFDDAQQDNHRYARPILARYSVKASFFVPVAAVERQELLWHDRLGFSVVALLEQPPDGRDRLKRLLADAGLSAHGPGSIVENIVQSSKKLFLSKRLHLVEELENASGAGQAPGFARLMTFKELADLAEDGHEIGSHSMTHCMMPECDDHALAYELTESRRILQSRLGQPVESFCYPNGNSDARSAKAVADAGYLRAVTTDWGLNRKNTDPYRLRRCDMDASRIRDTRGGIVVAALAFRMRGVYPGLS